MICSPSGFCFSSSWSIVSCGKRGSLPIAGGANMVAANQPPAAAGASDDIQIADFMISSGYFFMGGGMLVQPHQPRQPGGEARRSDRADIAEALLREGH